MADWSRAFVEEEKVTNYLLNTEHPTGAGKARLFRSFGYEPSDWRRLRDDLLIAGRTGATERTEQNAYGQKFVRDGVLAAPNGRHLVLRTVWIVDSGSDAPRLVTAYPK